MEQHRQWKPHIQITRILKLFLGKVTTSITQAPSNNHSRGLINVHFVYVCMDVSDTVQLKDNALSMPSLCLALF